MYKVVLLRHGESTWNLENRFTGWTDVDLSLRGIAEAHRAGLLLKADGYVFDVAFTSVLKRAIRTLWIALDEMGPYVDSCLSLLAFKRTPRANSLWSPSWLRPRG